MRILVSILAALFLFGCQSMSGTRDADAEIAALTQKWADAMSRHDVDGVVSLYDPQAVLWGTRSAKLRDSPKQVRDYFNILQTVPPTYKAVLGEQRIRVYGDTAVNTGTYTFSEMRDGKELLRPARFSFVFHRKEGRWLIVDHHSSAVPGPA